MLSLKHSWQIYHRILAFADKVSDPHYPPDDLGRFGLTFWRNGIRFTALTESVYFERYFLAELRQQMEESKGWNCLGVTIMEWAENEDRPLAKALLEKMEKQLFVDFVTEINFRGELVIVRPVEIPSIDDLLPIPPPCYP